MAYKCGGKERRKKERKRRRKKGRERGRKERRKVRREGGREVLSYISKIFSSHDEYYLTINHLR